MARPPAAGGERARCQIMPSNCVLKTRQSNAARAPEGQIDAGKVQRDTPPLPAPLALKPRAKSVFPLAANPTGWLLLLLFLPGF